jgi:hypothetical protein
MAVIAEGENMKKTVCMLLVMTFLLILTPGAKAGNIDWVEYPLNGSNYYNADIISLEMPIAECAKDNSCEETNDPCLEDNSCVAEINCVTFATSFHDGNWRTLFNGGGISCNWSVLNVPAGGDTIINNDNTTNNDYTTNNDNTTQNGAVFTIEKKEPKNKHSR